MSTLWFTFTNMDRHRSSGYTKKTHVYTLYTHIWIIKMIKRENKQSGHIPHSVWREIEISNDFTSQKKYKYQSSIPLLIQLPCQSHSLSFSSPNSLTHTLYFSSLSLISHLWQSHQLLHPKVTAHTQYVLDMLPCVMESKIKRFSNFISQISQTYPLRNQVKVTSKYPNELVRLQSFNADSLFLSFFLSQRSWNEFENTPWKKMKTLKWKIEEISLRKHDNYQDFERKN